MKNKKGLILFSLLTFISCFFCIKVSALIYTSSGVYPDKPDGNANYLIFNRKYNNVNTVSLLSYSPYSGYSSTPYREGQAATGYSIYLGGAWYKLYNLNNGSWTKIADAGCGASFGCSWDYISIIATTKSFTPHSANYGFIDPPTFYFHLNGGNVSAIDISQDLTFFYNDDFTVSSDNVSKLNKIFNNSSTTKKGYEFGGWYLDEDFTIPFTQNFQISSNTHLYAKWINKIYYVNDIDYIEIKFDNFPFMETNVNYDYTIRSVFADGSENTVDFSQPHGREYYTGCDDDNSNCSPNLRYKDKLFYDMGFVGYYYTHSENLKFNSNPDHITSSYSVIIPLETSIANWIYIDFNSNYDYEIIVHYKNDENDETSVSNYLQTIDLTNKYGAIFLPLYDNSAYADLDSYYLTHFKVLGTIDIQVTDSRDIKDYNILQLYSMNYCNSFYLEQNDIPYNCDNLSGVFKFKIDNLTAGQTLRFVNVNYSSSTDVVVKITYDSRYFNYGILNAPYSDVDIVDPTTGETYKTSLSEFYNQLNGTKSNKDFKSSLARFVKPISFIFEYVSKIFNNYLSPSLQDFFFFCFCLSLIILLLRVIF